MALVVSMRDEERDNLAVRVTRAPNGLHPATTVGYSIMVLALIVAVVVAWRRGAVPATVPDSLPGRFRAHTYTMKRIVIEVRKESTGFGNRGNGF